MSRLALSVALGFGVLAGAIAARSARDAPAEQPLAAASSGAQLPAPALDRVRLDVGAIERMESEIRELRASVAALEAALRSRKEQATPLGLGPPVAAASPEALRARLDRMLGRELREREERDLAEQLEPRLVESLPRGAALRAIACSASLCKLELSYPDEDSYRAFVATSFGSSKELLWNGPIVVDVLSDSAAGRGDVLAIAYLGRRADAFD